MYGFYNTEGKLRMLINEQYNFINTTKEAELILKKHKESGEAPVFARVVEVVDETPLKIPDSELPPASNDNEERERREYIKWLKEYLTDSFVNEKGEIIRPITLNPILIAKGWVASHEQENDKRKIKYTHKDYPYTICCIF